MVFSSLSFIFCLLPLFLVLDFFCFDRVKWRNLSLIIISLLFYTWGEKNYVILLLAMAFFNYIFGNIIFKISNKNNKLETTGGYSKLTLIATVSCISVNLLCLCFYKYLFFIISNISLLFPSLNLTAHPKHLPLGISFFTFHAISYITDIYKGVIKEKPKALTFFSYFFMFPHLVAGPIVRYADLCLDIESRKKDHNLFCYGVGRFLLGLNKKILIANTMASVADLVFLISPEVRSFSDVWLGAIAYSLQIYFDFSGYSDMAIGLAKIFGFDLLENFNYPYAASSITDFWKRWHISLTNFFRDYVYIPLGGNRKSSKRTVLNRICVFFLTGLWHGASFNFIFWGLFHGFSCLSKDFSSLTKRVKNLNCSLYFIELFLC